MWVHHRVKVLGKRRSIWDLAHAIRTEESRLLADPRLHGHLYAPGRSVRKEYWFGPDAGHLYSPRGRWALISWDPHTRVVTKREPIARALRPQLETIAQHYGISLHVDGR